MRGAGTTSLIAVASVSDNTLYTSDVTCTVGNYTFSNFEVYSNSPFDTGDPFEIQISGTSNGGEIGLVFGTDITAGQDYQFEYEITGGIDNMTLSNGGLGTASITEYICSGAITLPGSTCGTGNTQLATLGALGGAVTSTAVAFSTNDFVFKDLDGGNMQISEFAQTIAPEPMTLSLMGVGLLGLGFLGRRRKK